MMLIVVSVLPILDGAIRSRGVEIGDAIVASPHPRQGKSYNPLKHQEKDNHLGQQSRAAATRVEGRWRDCARKFVD